MEERKSDPVLSHGSAPLGGNDPRSGGTVRAIDDGGVRLQPDDTSKSGEDASSIVRRAHLQAYLSEPATQARISALVSAFVASRTPQSVKDDIAQEANVAALVAKSLPRSTKTMQGWLATVTRRTVFHHFRRDKADRAWLDREADLDEQPDDSVEAPDDQWLVSHWLAPAVANDERDQETYEIIRYKAATGRTDAQVAEDHGMTYAAWTHRLSRFKQKYVARWRRRQLFVIILLGGIVGLVAIVAWLLWRTREPDIVPDVTFPVPRAAPSASAIPSAGEPFTPARPTTPDMK